LGLSSRFIGSFVSSDLVHAHLFPGSLNIPRGSVGGDAVALTVPPVPRLALSLAYLFGAFAGFLPATLLTRP
jgi:hypothetical protein